GRRRIDYFVASASLAGKLGVERVLADEPLHPHKPVWLEVAVGGEPALVPVLDTPASLLDPEGPEPLGPRPDADAAWERLSRNWASMRSGRDVEGLWQCWCTCAEGWLADWTGNVDERFRGRGRCRRLIYKPAQSGRAVPGLGKVGRAARRWLQAWRWLQDLARAVTASGPAAELKVRRLMVLLGGCLQGLGDEWARR
ncbi:MAG: hypothetical protein ACKPKO_12120, partial [Candidatus Fonsibacter sp.]